MPAKTGLVDLLGPPDHLLISHPSFSDHQAVFCRLLATSNSVRAAIMQGYGNDGLLAVEIRPAVARRDDPPNVKWLRRHARLIRALKLHQIAWKPRTHHMAVAKDYCYADKPRWTDYKCTISFDMRSVPSQSARQLAPSLLVGMTALTSLSITLVVPAAAAARLYLSTCLPSLQQLKHLDLILIKKVKCIAWDSESLDLRLVGLQDLLPLSLTSLGLSAQLDLYGGAHKHHTLYRVELPHGVLSHLTGLTQLKTGSYLLLLDPPEVLLEEDSSEEATDSLPDEPAVTTAADDETGAADVWEFNPRLWEDGPSMCQQLYEAHDKAVTSTAAAGSIKQAVPAGAAAAGGQQPSSTPALLPPGLRILLLAPHGQEHLLEQEGIDAADPVVPPSLACLLPLVQLQLLDMSSTEVPPDQLAALTALTSLTELPMVLSELTSLSVSKPAWPAGFTGFQLADVLGQLPGLQVLELGDADGCDMMILEPPDVFKVYLGGADKEAQVKQLKTYLKRGSAIKSLDISNSLVLSKRALRYLNTKRMLY
eukprot:gene1711-2056_t